MMDWKEKIHLAMMLLKEGCTENTEWNKCYDCPFEEYCDLLHGNIPSDFVIKTLDK